MKVIVRKGFGFPVYVGKYENFESVKDFICSYKDDIDQDYILDAEDDEELAERLKMPVCEAIAEILRQQTGNMSFKGFEHSYETNIRAHVGVETGFPWEFIESKDSFLSKELATLHLKRYGLEFGQYAEPYEFEIVYAEE